MRIIMLKIKIKIINKPINKLKIKQAKNLNNLKLIIKTQSSQKKNLKRHL